MKFSTCLSFPISLALSILPALVTAQDPLALNNYYSICSIPAQRLYINQTQALAVISVAAVKTLGYSPSNIAITDPSGIMVAFLRTDNAWMGSIDISMKKARTVSLFNGAFTPADLYNASLPNGGRYAKHDPRLEETNGGLVVFGGGLPIDIGSHFIGAVGVSGGTVDQHVTVATAGVQAIGSMTASSK